MQHFGIRHAALSVENVEASVRFYGEILGFLPYYVTDKDWGMMTRSGTTLSFVRVAKRDKLDPMDDLERHYAHVGMTVESPEVVDAMHVKLNRLNIKTGKVVKHRDGSYGFYFTDPDKNLLEWIFIPHVPYPKLQQMTLLENRSETAIVAFAHGSRDENWLAPFEKIENLLKLHLPDVASRIAYLEMASPNLLEAVDSITMSFPVVKRVCIVPLFLGAGAHLLKDLPPKMQEVQKKYPEITLELAEAAGVSPIVQEALVVHAIEFWRQRVLSK